MVLSLFFLQVLDVFGTVDILLKSDGAIGLLGLEGV